MEGGVCGWCGGGGGEPSLVSITTAATNRVSVWVGGAVNTPPPPRPHRFSIRAPPALRLSDSSLYGLHSYYQGVRISGQKNDSFQRGARSNYQETRCARLDFLKLNTLVRSRFIRKLAVRVIHIISNSMRYSWVYRQDTSQNNTWDEMLHNKSLTVVIWIVFIDFCRYPTCGHRDWRYQDQCCASFKNSEHLKNIKL